MHPLQSLLRSPVRRKLRTHCIEICPVAMCMMRVDPYESESIDIWVHICVFEITLNVIINTV